VGCGALQLGFGSQDDFYEHSFITTKDPSDLVEFYGGEGLMEVFCVFPWVVEFLMRSGFWDDDGVYHTFGLPFGSMEASMEFIEDEDTSSDGEVSTTAFKKHEKFHDSLWGVTLWDMTTNFGFRTRDDGQVECYQHGETYRGFFPMRLVFQLKSYYDIWATKKHINSDAFGSTEEYLEDRALAQTKNIPLHAFKEFLTGLTYDVQRTGGDIAKLQAKIQELEEKLRVQEEEKLKNVEAKLEEKLGAVETELQEIRKTAVRVKVKRKFTRPSVGPVTSVRLVVDDSDMQDTIKSAMIHLREAESNKWNLRQVTPTWIDGNAVGPSSQAWTRLLEHTDVDLTLNSTPQAQPN